MATVRDCDLPEDLYYDVESNIWARPEADGTVTVGMTSYGCSLAGPLVSFLAKPVGKEVKPGKSCATVESGKWVGPVKAPVGGEIVAVNDAVVDNPGLINEAPYGDGWLLRLKPSNWDGDSALLVRGDEALRRFEEKMQADGFGGC